MKAMLTVVLFSVLGVTGSCYAQDKITIICKSEEADCPARIIAYDSAKEECRGTRHSSLSDSIQSAPALPPVPKVPPVPPRPLGHAALPAPPAPPAPPMIQVPDEAHLACVGKKTGTEITWEYENKASLTGICSERKGKVFLKLRHVYIANSSAQ